MCLSHTALIASQSLAGMVVIAVQAGRWRKRRAQRLCVPARARAAWKWGKTGALECNPKPAQKTGDRVAPRRIPLITANHALLPCQCGAFRHDAHRAQTILVGSGVACL